MVGRENEPSRVEVWMAMADHFLDTETRHTIPLTAMCCLDAGLSVRQAREAWCYEVSPAVGFNLWTVAGQWGGWDRDWLVTSIADIARRSKATAGIARWMRYRFRVQGLHGVWIAIARSMELLSGFDDPAQRRRTARDLYSLARHYVDFGSRDDSAISETDLVRLRALFPDPLLHLMHPAMLRRERSSGARRVRVALGIESSRGSNQGAS
jgi:hypothetical protein